MFFHLKNLFLCVCVIGDVDEVFNLWWIQFLVFGRDEQSCHTNQLQVLSRCSLNSLNKHKKRFEMKAADFAYKVVQLPASNDR